MLWLLAPAFTLLVLFLSLGFVASSMALGEHQDWRTIGLDPFDYRLRNETVHFRTSDGLKLSAWWLPAPLPGRGAIILVPGMQGNRSTVVDRAPIFVQNGFDVLCLDTRAHGDSEGDYMTTGYKEALDILAAAAFIRQRRPGVPVAVLGYSRGATAALQAAAQSDAIAAVVADSPFINNARVRRESARFVRQGNEFPFLLKAQTTLLALPGVDYAARFSYWLQEGIDPAPPEWDLFRQAPQIRRAHVLYIAGELDPIVSSHELRRLQALTQRSQLVLLKSGSGHDVLFDSRPQYNHAIMEFLDRVIPAPHPSSK